MVRPRLNYADALALLAGESPEATALDRALGGALSGTSGGGGQQVAGLLEARSELIRLGDRLIRSVRDRSPGLPRHDRTRRLHAAHAVLVITAFWAALDGLELPFELNDLRVHQAGALDRSELVEAVLHTDLPLPSPARPFDATREELKNRYQGYAFDLQRFLQGLAVWDELDATVQSDTRAVLQTELAHRAIISYDMRYRRLAEDVPEFAWWGSRPEHGAARDRGTEPHKSLAELESLLRKLPVGARPDGWRAALAVAHQAALERPILAEWETSSELVMPNLNVAYVDPDFKIGGVLGSSSPASEAYWGAASLRTDLAHFLAGYLTTSFATAAPLLILGQPGAGKSVLTRVVAARLPAEDFLPVRVELREVPADADLRDQIEYGISASTGEPMSWTELTSAARGVLPVVMLDGFDELLQATGVSQTDYLDRVARFQQREAAQGRPVAVIVTSRTSVADRARIPPGSVLIRLEPFRRAHIERWLAAWNRANAAQFEAREMAPFPAETALRYHDLAEHPLLLLMLALYDADANVLQNDAQQIDEVELYERLLSTFSEREVRKNRDGFPDEGVVDLVEDELLRLSVVAFAMFNRGRQWTTAAELEADLEALLGRRPVQPAGFRAPLTQWEAVLGRFFFIQRAQALRDGARLSTYEFLHATFGEYLVARLVHRVLLDLAAQERATARAALGGGGPRDGLVHALLSFTTLTARSSVLRFLQLMSDRLPAEQRSARGLPVTLFRRIDVRVDDQYSHYQPVRLPMPSRYGRYGINLVLLAAACNGAVTARTLLPSAGDPIPGWRRHALLWQSSLTPEEWSGLLNAVRVERRHEAAGRDLSLALGSSEDVVEPVDLSWTFASNETRGALSHILGRQAALLCDQYGDLATHTFEPLMSALGRLSDVYTTVDPAARRDRATTDPPARTVLNALLSLWSSSEVNAPVIDLHEAYQCILRPLGDGFAESGNELSGRLFAMVLNRLVADARVLDTAAFVSILGFAITLESRTIRQGDLVVEAILNHLGTHTVDDGADAAELRHIASFVIRTQPFLWLRWFVGLHELGRRLPAAVVPGLPWAALPEHADAPGKGMATSLPYVDRGVLARAKWLLRAQYQLGFEELVGKQSSGPGGPDADWASLNELWARSG